MDNFALGFSGADSYFQKNVKRLASYMPAQYKLA